MFVNTNDNVIRISPEIAKREFLPITLIFNTVTDTTYKIYEITDNMIINVITETLSDYNGIVRQMKPPTLEIDIITHPFGIDFLNECCLSFRDDKQFKPLYGIITEHMIDFSINSNNYISKIKFVGVMTDHVSFGEPKPIIERKENNNEEIKKRIRKINRRFTL